MAKGILVVSDDGEAIRVVQETLTRTAGYEVIVISDGAEALTTIEELINRRKLENDPDLVVLDDAVKTPRGEALYEQLHQGHKLLFLTGVKNDRQGTPLYELPFIVLWNRRLKEAPPFSLDKPIDPRQLLNFIRHHLNEQDRYAAREKDS